MGGVVDPDHPAGDRSTSRECFASSSIIGLQVIGALKLTSGLLLAIAGVGAFRLMGRDLGGAIDDLVTRLHLDPENRLVHAVISLISGIDRAHLAAIGVGTVFYAALHFLEGTGLFLRRRWAEYLTVVATGSLVPIEICEIAAKPGALRVAVVAVNLVVVAYLVNRLIRDSPGLRVGGERCP
jgi:uncharacterized membrane protein (DUF2068 family)